MATEAAKRWNDQWWEIVVQKKKHDLSVTDNARKKAKKVAYRRKPSG